MLSTLHSKLMEAIGRTELTTNERRAIDPAVQAFSDWSCLGRLVKDICIYIKASIAHKERHGETVILIIADDHKFFKYFALSEIAENVLVTQVQTLVKEAQPRPTGVMDSRPPVRIKVAGEVIWNVSISLITNTCVAVLGRN